MFQPVVPLGGYVGWRFLERTQDNQQEIFANAAPIKRATDAFREEISTIRSAAELVNNRELLSVALGAYGLDDDIDSRFFIEKILTDGTNSTDALANRLSDKRYLAFSQAFGFGDETGPRTGLSGFADTIIARFEKKQFERAVGEQNNDFRLAMNVAESLTDITTTNQGKDAQWFAIMGNPPLRQVFETALGLPSSIARIDVDQQLTMFKERASSTFGSDRADALLDADEQEKLIRLFLVRSQSSNNTQISGASAALTLLQSARPLF